MNEPNRTPEPTGNLQRVTLAVLAGIATVMVLIITSTVIIHAEQSPVPRPIIRVVHVSGTVAVDSIDYLSVSPGVKPGPHDQLHDAFSQTTFNVHAGTPIKLVIDNTDNAPHSITSSAAGVDIIVRPGTHSYLLKVDKPGEFTWHCNQPCDPYSMSHMGYMMGTIVSEVPQRA